MYNINDEYQRLERDLASNQDKLRRFRKGNLRKRIIRGKEYHYLQFREGGRVRSVYIHAEDVDAIKREIRERKDLEKAIKEIQSKLKECAAILGLHRSYRPVRDVDYEEYTLFMSAVAHDYKTLDRYRFAEKYRTSKYRGINKRYLIGFYDYVNGIDRLNVRRTNDLVLDPYTYLMYFKYGQKETLEEEIKRAIPAFLNQGLLVTDVQEAVNGTLSE